MLGLLAHLNEPQLVAGFQRRCGLFLVEAPQHNQDTRALEEEPCGGARSRRGRQDPNSNYKYEQNGCAAEVCSKPKYEVRNKFLHLLFLLSASLGHEVFYITCLPCVEWNVDPFLCRRLVNMWTFVMYIGQVMKDVLKLPRPRSPPVVKLEMRVDAEYGLPSTHAMAATAISFTLLLSAPSRVQFPFHLGLLTATAMSTLVSLSRLYTGMHSVLDVICGLLISGFLLLVTFPYWEAIDHFQLTNIMSPFVALSLGLLLSFTYPDLDHYSPTRGDTTTILGSWTGSSIGYWVNQRVGQTFEPEGVLPVPLPSLTPHRFAVGVSRCLVGIAALLATRHVMKTLSLRALYWWYNVPKKDHDAKRRKEIEVPYKLATYTSVGLVNSMLVHRLFLLLGLL
ncbi:sphingosine-1-phosphate phosphatase 2 [Synchiropus splendidus]|uniref:sphingosine-1-phosphate phosphatase 2 n=1 Tax=Synchiropus splendidus TaxID=270530 RepID=UPI00237D9A94|nr:sphingosine-1-phosphate phosphatase 2 [Synchiropus splendidus]